MKVLFLTSEIEGLVKTGGLADVARALPFELSQQGIDVKIVIPYYKQHIDQSLEIEIPALDVSLSNDSRHGVAIRHTKISGISVYLVEHNRLFDRDGIYDNGYHAYEDNAVRYGVLSKASLNLCEALNWYPDILHCNDWQTAIAPYYLKHHMIGHRGFKKTKSLLTIHNAFFQGRIPNPQRVTLGIDEKFYQSMYFEDHQMVNLLKAGIMFADGVSTVSPGYRDELLEPKTSHGLWQTFNSRKDHFKGILNGCDYRQWNPETDHFIKKNYSLKDLSGKAVCKAELQKTFGLQVDPDCPVFGLVSRLTDQKGLNYLLPAIKNILESDSSVQFILLGSGDPVFVRKLNELETVYPNNLCFYEGYNNSLAHQIESGSDYFLMPSLFEPCGLNQIYSLKYGTLPIVRETGGLKNTVVGINKNSSNIKKATGISFKKPDIKACENSIKTAIDLWYNHPEKFQQIQINAMNMDFSWQRPAIEYLALYKKLISENAP